MGAPARPGRPRDALRDHSDGLRRGGGCCVRGVVLLLLVVADRPAQRALAHRRAGVSCCAPLPDWAFEGGSGVGVLGTVRCPIGAQVCPRRRDPDAGTVTVPPQISSRIRYGPQKPNQRTPRGDAPPARFSARPGTSPPPPPAPPP